MIEVPPIPLTQHDLLDRNACESTRDKVMDLKAYWRECSPTFFTLGAASYLDAPRQLGAYLDAAKERNTLLGEAFAPEYKLLKHFFEELLREPVLFDSRLALPGFHIFILNGVNRSGDNVAARAHFDLQWMYAIPNCVPTGTLSFTLPIEEPTGGASMEVWPFRYTDALRLGVSAVNYASKNGSETVKYTMGRMVIHDGLTLHAIGRAGTIAPSGYRITLQGHGVRLSEGWFLYW
jgi:hypothetical protein